MKRRNVVIVITLIVLVLAGVVFLLHHKSSPAPAAPAFAIQAADNLAAQGKLIEARKMYKDALSALEDKPETFAAAQKHVEDLNMQILLSPRVDENSFEYTVQSGDSLTKIARQNNTTIELIKKINNLTLDVLRLGQKLKIINAKFYLVIDKSQNTLSLKRGDETIKTYLVSTGANNCTPVGTFKIVNKLVNPTWFKAGAIIPAESPDNILGPRWMGFDLKGYGIHGTAEPDKLGQQVSKGCVRMRNDELIELYDLVPAETEVTIAD